MKCKYFVALGFVAALTASVVAGAFIPANARGMLPVIVVRNAPSDHAAVMAKITSTQGLVPFFGKGHWVKVGSANSGKVGWIDTAQFHKQAMRMRQVKQQRAMDQRRLRTQQGPRHLIAPGAPAQAKTFVRNTPYGKVVTTERQGMKNGVHYKILESRVIDPRGAKQGAQRAPAQLTQRTIMDQEQQVNLQMRQQVRQEVRDFNHMQREMNQTFIAQQQ
jgi:hypothetical protein